MPGLDEFGLISRYFVPLAQSCAGALGLTDDAAFLPPDPTMETVLTTDMLVAGVHFFADDPPDLIARKLVRTNLSDLAAKAAEPVGMLLGLSLPSQTSPQWLGQFAAGLAADVAEFSCPLMGGDTVSTSGPLTLSLTALGRVPITQPRLLRSTAQVGDDLWVSGTLGDAAWGLAVAKGEAESLAEAHQAFLLDRYRCPQPRLLLRDLLRVHAHAAMDISDGLIQDLGHICAASDVGAVVLTDMIPLSAAGQAISALDSRHQDFSLTGGDDYEILFTAAVDSRSALHEWAKAKEFPLTRIGSIVSGAGVVLQNGPSGAPVAAPIRGGWRHFAAEGEGL